jgi:hypothetical protein
MADETSQEVPEKRFYRIFQAFLLPDRGTAATTSISLSSESMGLC